MCHALMVLTHLVGSLRSISFSSSMVPRSKNDSPLPRSIWMAEHWLGSSGWPTMVNSLRGRSFSKPFRPFCPFTIWRPYRGLVQIDTMRDSGTVPVRIWGPCQPHHRPPSTFSSELFHFWANIADPSRGSSAPNSNPRPGNRSCSSPRRKAYR